MNKICIEFTKGEIDNLRQYMEILAYDYFQEKIKKTKIPNVLKNLKSDMKKCENLEKFFSMASKNLKG